MKSQSLQFDFYSTVEALLSFVTSHVLFVAFRWFCYALNVSFYEIFQAHLLVSLHF